MGGLSLGKSVLIGRAKPSEPPTGLFNQDFAIYIYMCVCRGPKCVGGITWAKLACMLKVSFRRLKLTCDTRVILYNYTLEQLESNLRLQKVVASKQLRLAMETEEERRARLENDAATKRLRLAMETDKERKSRLEKMVATAQLMLALIKGVVYVGVVLSLIPILKSWQLCLSFKLNVVIS